MACTICPPTPTRRSFLKFGIAGAGALVGMRPLTMLAQDTVAKSKNPKALILVWLGGGPSQLDTWDPKPGKKTGGAFKAIETAAKGIHVSEHMPRIAAQMKNLSIIRTMSTMEAAHERGTYLLHSCYSPIPGQDFAAMGTVVSYELHQKDYALPEYVAIQPPAIPTTPVLGDEFLPFQIGSIHDPIPNVRRSQGVGDARQDAREKLLEEQNREFEARREGREVNKIQTAMKKAEDLMGTPLLKAFNVREEKDEVRKEYGDGFGMNCLLARRLVEAGVKYVEVGHGGWDTHDNNFDQVKDNLGTLDPGVGALMKDLEQRSLLKDTMVVVMGEFGRTPEINATNGRDHWCKCFSVALGGGGIPGGRLIGETSADGMEIARRAVSVPELFSTIYTKLGIDPEGSYIVNTRKVPYAYRAKPIKELMT